MVSNHLLLALVSTLAGLPAHVYLVTRQLHRLSPPNPDHVLPPLLLTLCYVRLDVGRLQAFPILGTPTIYTDGLNFILPPSVRLT